MNNYDQLYLAANLLIDISENAQNERKGFKHDIGLAAWRKEFQTIKFSTSRQSGHSECIRKLINDRFDKNVILVMHSQNMVKCFLRKEGLYKADYPIFTFNNVKNCFRGRDYSKLQAIIVDTATLSMSKEKEDLIYKEMYNAIYPQSHEDDPFFFIFVQ